MNKARLYIGGRLADCSPEKLILMTFTSEDLTNPTTILNSYSQQITLPGTSANNAIFGHFYRADRRTTSTGFNALQRAPFSIVTENSEVLVSGYAKLESVERTGADVHSYSVSLYGNLGGFFQGLTYREDGSEKTLADMMYKNKYGSPFIMSSTRLNIDAESVSDAWNWLRLGGTAGLDSWYNVINFAPCYNGLPEEPFDAKRAIANIGEIYNLTTQTDSGYLYESNYNNAVLITMAEGKDEWEMRDLRAWRQRPVLSVSAFIDAVSVSGFTFSATPAVKLRLTGLWLTLPMIAEAKTSIMGSDLMKATVTPSKMLTNLAKTFGLVLRCDGTAVTMMTRQEYYQRGETIDLTDRIDTRKSITISPFMFDAKTYTWSNDVKGLFADDYAAKYGRPYGAKRVNTGYSFNTTDKTVTDGISNRGAAMVLQTSPNLVSVRPYNPGTVTEIGVPAFMPSQTEEVKYKLYRATDRSQSKDFVLAYNVSDGAIYQYSNLGDPFEDAFEKAQFYGTDRTATDGDNVLLYFNGIYNLPNYAKLNFQLTDEPGAALKTALGVEGTCWDLRRGIGYQMSRLPMFSRWKADTKQSLDFGMPFEIAVPRIDIEEYTFAFDAYWRDYITDRYDVDSRVMRCWVNLRGLRVNQDLLRNFFWYQNALWVLNKIDNHSIATDDLTKCEFIKVKDKRNYTE